MTDARYGRNLAGRDVGKMPLKTMIDTTMLDAAMQYQRLL